MGERVNAARITPSPTRGEGAYCLLSRRLLASWVGRDSYPAANDGSETTARSRMPNYRRYYIAGRAVFVTVVTRKRLPWFADAAHVDLLMNAMQGVKEIHPYEHIAHVVLPDHFHWMFALIGDGNFSRVVAAIKRDITWRIKEAGQKVGAGLWQARFYDHVIRNDDDFSRHLDYIHYNPVKHGLAASAHVYAYSSFTRWVEQGVYPDNWGSVGVEPVALKGMNLE